MTGTKNYASAWRAGHTLKKRIISLFLSAVCYLGIHNGYLALFDEGQPQPLMVLPYRAEIYPQEDQKALQQGIRYESQQELSQLLEDFLS